MEFRSAFSTAISLGVLLGVALAGARSSSSPDPSAHTAPAPLPRVVEVPVTFDLPVVWNASVERFVNLFREEQTDRMALYLKRAGRYEGMIRGKLRERGMPEDLLYLSMIESGFNPTARSKAQAVGLWQFIAATARNYGLRVDSYVDERRDPEKSTDAALDYLQDLYEQFGSWNLAAAAYNTGENRVARIMREETGSERGEESDFWRIRSRLPRDTREYVPLIYAMAMVGKEPQKYGLERVERWLPVSTDTVAVPGGTDLGAVAAAVQVTVEDLRKLNPHLLKGITPPGEAYPVRVPDGRADLYRANFERARETAKSRPAEESEKAEERQYRVRRGDTLWLIARRHDVSVVALQRANDLGRRTTLRPGQILRIPA